MTDPGRRPPGLGDTIVAPATAAGLAERAIVRLSGPAAAGLVARTLGTPPDPPARRMLAASLDLGGGARVPLEVVVFAAPRSATGEDVVEVHLPSWPPVVTELLRRLVRAGARPAGRGEFTRRALATGRLDVTQAVAVGRLGSTGSAEEAAEAASVLADGLARRHDALRDLLLDALALVEAHLDFEDEDTEAVTAEEIRRALGAAREAARTARRQARLMPSRDGETDVVLLGPPNAGKSALFRALCPGAATTVSPRPGTTRDALEARVTRGGRRWRIVDGPGLVVDGAPGGEGATDLDRRAAERFAAAIPSGAVVLAVDDVTVPRRDDLERARALLVGDRPWIAVLNKVDLVRDAPAAGGAGAGAVAVVPVSALRREGLETLWAALVEGASVPAAPDLPARATAEAADAVLAVLDDVGGEPPGDALPLVALALREAVARLEQEAEAAPDVTEAVLARIFEGFCIGK